MIMMKENFKGPCHCNCRKKTELGQVIVKKYEEHKVFSGGLGIWDFGH